MSELRSIVGGGGVLKPYTEGEKDSQEPTGRDMTLNSRASSIRAGINAVGEYNCES